MKTKYQYISFYQEELEGKNVWVCRNNKSLIALGFVAMYHQWRQYCYFPAEPAVYSLGCLADIQDFIKQLQTSTTNAK